MTGFEIYKKLIFPEGGVKYGFLFLIILLLILGYATVEATGGTSYAYLHLLYIPILLSGFVFSVRGGILAGLVAGFLMSPYMFHYYGYELIQPFASWALRMLMFTLIGAVAGKGASVFKSYIEELELKQITDPLTGLPNLAGLMKTFSKYNDIYKKAITIIVVELYHMQEIDRVLGEEGTNALMQQVAEDLKKAIGTNGILGRLQTYRFAIIVPHEAPLTEILESCERLSENAYHIDNIPLFVEMRFGTTRYPIDAKDLKNLIRKALMAINMRENQAQRISRFIKYVDDSSERNLLILHQLKIALEEKTFVLEYQPQVNIQTEKVSGFEALVRWVDPILGPVSPEEFIPLIEETLLIKQFTEWVLETAIQQLHLWKKAEILVPISVNFSTKNLQNYDLVETVSRSLEKFEIPPEFLEIEVTETSVASNIAAIAKILRSLREVGVRIAIDDFGTGQASQQYLFELPLNVIKIDKLFVESVFHNPAAAAIVKNAIMLAHDLGLEVIAEGLETRNQHDLLKEWGCDIGQGYLFGKSMKSKDATDWLKKMLKA
jgi:EAL domain-containing protein (putative c-di-GMP-specific phosphodiesterase class I)/GGDEF domain-containing protein